MTIILGKYLIYELISNYILTILELHVHHYNSLVTNKINRHLSYRNCE